MTNEELIIGHFAHSLTASEETMLQERMRQSAEMRTMYDQHKNLESRLTADAAAIKPSSRLDEITVAAALSLIPEIVGGGGALAWLSGKVILTVTSVIVSGVAVTYFATRGSNDASSSAPAPVVRTIPAPPAAAPPAPTVQTPAAEAPAMATPAPAAVEQPVVRDGSARTANTRSDAKHAPRSNGRHTLGIDATNPPVMRNKEHIGGR